MTKFLGDHIRVSYVFLSSFTRLVKQRNAYGGNRSTNSTAFASFDDAAEFANSNRTNGTVWNAWEVPSIVIGSRDSEIEVREAALLTYKLPIEKIDELPLTSSDQLALYLTSLLGNSSSFTIFPSSTKRPARLPLASYRSLPGKRDTPLEWSLLFRSSPQDVLIIAQLIAQLTDYIENTSPRTQ